jgi:hypothetical protein
LRHVGPVRVRVFHTGLLPQTQAANITAGRTMTLDFNLADAGMNPAVSGGATVKLDRLFTRTNNWLAQPR